MPRFISSSPSLLHRRNAIFCIFFFFFPWNPKGRKRENLNLDRKKAFLFFSRKKPLEPWGQKCCTHYLVKEQGGSLVVFLFKRCKDHCPQKIFSWYGDDFSNPVVSPLVSPYKTTPSRLNHTCHIGAGRTIIRNMRQIVTWVFRNLWLLSPTCGGFGQIVI